LLGALPVGKALAQTPLHARYASTAPSSESSAGAGLQAAVVQLQQTTKFKVYLENPSPDLVRIRIRKGAGEVIYQEVVPDHQYIRQFDLALLPDGSYTFEVVSAQQVFLRLVELRTQPVARFIELSE
jgi:hypothetical protein